VNGGSPLIEGNTISGNVQDACSGGGGAGIAILFASTARIRRNVIRDNIAGAGNGGGLSLFGASGVVIERNTIAGNRAGGGVPCAQGGGIWIVNEANLTIAGNLITGNTAGCGGGIYNAASQST